MSNRLLFLIAAILSLTGVGARAQAVIEGRVALPKAHAAPVVNQRYAIVTKGGVVATDPPTAVVYLEGPFAKPAAQATAQMAQKDLAFVTPLLPVQVGTKVEFPNLATPITTFFPTRPRSVSTSGGIVPRSVRFPRRSSTRRAS